MRNFLLVLSILAATNLAAQKSDRQQLVDRLAKDLKSREPATREKAAESLGDLKWAEAIEPLVAALSDKDASVRREAASGLWSSSKVAQPAIPALRIALADPEPSVVIRAAGALISMDVEPESIAEPLRLVLQRGDVVDRFLAARALIGIERAENLASPILDYLRRNAPDPKAGGGDSDNFEVGTKALRRLAETQERTMIAPLVARLQENPYLTEPVLLALGDFRTPPDKWVETLIPFLGSPIEDVRETTAELLGKQRAAADVKLWARPVSRLLSDPKPRVRAEAIRSLKEGRGFALDAIEPLLTVVKSDSDEDLRESAAEAVGEIADAAFPIDTAIKAAAAKQALPVLTVALEKDPQADVRSTALKSIDRLQLDPAVIAPILARAAVEQKDTFVRHGALQRLRDRGADAASTAETIRPLLNDPDEAIRKMTEWAIDSMKSTSVRNRALTTTAATDPAVRDRALETLRDYRYELTEEGYYLALDEAELDVITAFLDAGMSPNQRFANLMGTPPMRVLLRAEEGCRPAVRPTSDNTKQILKLLLARGGDPNVTDEHGNTPLMAAVENCDAEVVKILLAAKANMNASNSGGVTAFDSGLWGETDGAVALVAAGFRLSAEKAKAYREAYAKDPKKLAFVNKAAKK